jgi:hypothetical protein
VTSVNKPPRVVSATPPTNVVELVGGAEQSFRLAVEDPERETLAYEWTVDGKKTGAQPTFTWKAQKEGKYRIKAIAKDQQGLTVAKEWQVVVVAPPSALPPPAPLVPENTAPHIAQRLPAERIVAAREGEVVQFSALALDPDGEEVSYGWLVDGQHAAQGDRFVYTAGAVGKHVIELKATDPGGLNDTFRWEVHVEAPPVAPRVVMHTPYEEWVLLYDHLSRFFAVEVEVPGLPEAPIQYAWQIDGRLAGGRELLEFKNQPPGQHEVTVTATGPSEASVTHRWVVDVRERERLDEHAVSGPPRLEMFALENEVSADKKRVTVKGQLRNVGSREAENIIVWISALDAQQKTLSRRLALPAPQPLSPGQVATFARSFVDQSAISDFHVEIVIK